MHIQACLLAVATLAAAPAAPQAHPSHAAQLPLAFHEVPFGQAPAEVEARLAPLEALSRPGGALAFAGTLDGQAVQLHALFTPRGKRLWKLAVVYLQPGERPFDELEGAWQRQGQALAARLGPPTRQLAYFKTPVATGGELAALKAGQAQFSAVWALADGYVACEISRFANVVVSYEHGALAARDDEERAATTRPEREAKPAQPRRH